MSPLPSAPATLPSKTGVTMLEPENTRDQARFVSSVWMPYEWKAKAAPRNTMPSVASAIGMCSAMLIAENAREKAENITTITKMSQMWLASQIGAIACRSASRCCALRGPRASRCHTPAPRSGPPVSAYRITPEPSKSHRISAQIVIWPAPRAGARATDRAAAARSCRAAR